MMKSIRSNTIQTNSSDSYQKQAESNAFRVKEKVVRRSRMERYLDILKVVAKHGPIKQTHIMYKANLSWIELKNSLSHLMKLKMITEIDDASGYLYAISETGVSTIYNYDKVEHTLISGGNPNPSSTMDNGSSSKWNF